MEDRDQPDLKEIEEAREREREKKTMMERESDAIDRFNSISALFFLHMHTRVCISTVFYTLEYLSLKLLDLPWEKITVKIGLVCGRQKILCNRVVLLEWAFLYSLYHVVHLLFNSSSRARSVSSMSIEVGLCVL